jgi:hypothetical protein
MGPQHSFISRFFSLLYISGLLRQRAQQQQQSPQRLKRDSLYSLYSKTGPSSDQPVEEIGRAQPIINYT